jgi:hypothetical protein
MYKSLRYGIAALSLALPLISHASQNFLSCSPKSDSMKICDVTFTSTPVFTNLCLATIQSGIYTIKNNTPVTLKINYIRIQSSDGLPGAATAIVVTPVNNCGTSLAAGASCNITLNLLPLSLGTFNRTLQIGVDTRQVELDGSAITSAVNCTPAGPAVPPAPNPPAPTPGPASLYQATILGATTVTNAGLTAVNGDVDVSPGIAITGFPPGTIVNGSQHAADATANTAHANAQTYYNSAVGLACQHNLSGLDLGGQTLIPGVYCFNTSAQLTGALTLAGASPNDSYTFIIGTTLTTASNSSVVLQGGVVNGNVTWAIGSSATLGSGTAFQGIIDATASITLNTGTSLAGRAWALNGAVTLNNNVVNPN